VATVAALTLLGGGGGSDPRRAGARGGMVEVTRETLVQREIVDGTLGYAGSRTVVNRLGDSGGAQTGSPDAAAVSFTPAQTSPDEGGELQGEDEPDPDPPTAQGDEPEQEEPTRPEADRPADQPDADNEQPQSDPPESAEQPKAPSDDADPGGYTGSGTVTALPGAGSVIRRNIALYRLDGDPVVLMYGSTPAYRALQAGVSDGRDVEELEQNLAALGFDPGAVDGSFSSTTAAAVSDWQEALGLDQTGAVELGRVVFLPGPRRVGERKTSVGSVLGSGSEVLETSSTKRVVSVELDASLQSMARRGVGVEVTLPDGATVRGRITRVGRVAREVDSGSGDPAAEQALVVDVTIELRSKRGIGRLDQAPVGVGLAQDSRRNVLAVPVNALVARRGGGYGVELARSHRILPVEAGMFADGYVEISGSGIREGARVVVPRD
jgi:peptidoglycan hydrolase-like protein with peptidoglycan-binding domain